MLPYCTYTVKTRIGLLRRKSPIRVNKSSNLNPTFIGNIANNSLFLGKCPTDETDYLKFGGQCYFFVQQNIDYQGRNHEKK